MAVTMPLQPSKPYRFSAKPIQEVIEDTELIGVSVKSAAKMLELSERSVWTLINDNKIRSVKCRSRVIISVQSLRDFVDEKV